MKYVKVILLLAVACISLITLHMYGFCMAYCTNH